MTSSPRSRRALGLLVIGGIFVVVAIASSSGLGYLGAAIVLAAAAATAAGVKGF